MARKIEGDLCKKVSGRFATKNCYGIEKANRINDMNDLKQYNQIYAYGDSRGDREMLTLAEVATYKAW